MIAIQHRIQTEENPDKIIYHPKCNYALVWGIANPGKSVMVSPISFMAQPIDHLAPLEAIMGSF